MNFSFSSTAIRTLIFVSCLYSCKENRMPDIEFDNIQIGKDVSLSEEEPKSPQCHVEMDIHYAKENGTDRDSAAQKINIAISEKLLGMKNTSVCNAVDSFVTTYTKNYFNKLSSLYKDDFEKINKSRWYEYKYSITTDVHSECERFTVYIANIYCSEGTENGINGKIVLNFDTATGGIITTDDIFVPGYESRLTEILLNALMKETGKRSITELHDEGFLYNMDMFIPENFIIGSNSIVFIYNVYEIAPYSKGRIELVINKSDINELLKK